MTDTTNTYDSAAKHDIDVDAAGAGYNPSIHTKDDDYDGDGKDDKHIVEKRVPVEPPTDLQTDHHHPSNNNHDKSDDRQGRRLLPRTGLDIEGGPIGISNDNKESIDYVGKGDIKRKLSTSSIIEKPYSIFTTREKWGIVIMASFGGLFSPLTANSYFPAIPTMAVAFGKSVELINLTVTMYMVFQGISPMFWGTLADRWGRRPMFLGCLLVLSVSCIGIAVQSTKDYWLLMVLRCLQSAGSASTIALGAGVIADIAMPAERGGFFGLFSLGPMLGPCIGPVIGGALAENLGWRAIFWFLCISSAVCLFIMYLTFPETLRAMVGDGSIPPPRFYRPPFSMIDRSREVSSTERPPHKRFVNPLRLFFYPDVALMLIFNATLYAVFYGVTASISILFKEVYPFLSETDIGLVFLAFGGGMVLGSAASGRVCDWEYRRLKNKLIEEAKRNSHLPGAIRPEDVGKEEYFPIEVARFQSMPYYVAVYITACVGYGWCLQARVNIAGPLILHVIMGYTIITIMNATQTLLIDLLPSQGSSITACNNLARCSFGAALVSVIQLILNAIGRGWTYVVLGALCVVVSPIMFIIMRMGPRWRAARRVKSNQH
ncbi:MFS transporter superfamily protein [Abortiporus biennis]